MIRALPFALVLALLPHRIAPRRPGAIGGAADQDRLTPSRGPDPSRRAPRSPQEPELPPQWAEQVNAAGGLSVKGSKRKIELISSDDRSDVETLRAHLREADDGRQGRPDPAAVGLTANFAVAPLANKLRLPAARADRAVRASWST